LREVVLGGPGSPVDHEQAASVWEAVAGAPVVSAALAAAGHRDLRQRSLTGAMTAAAVLGSCLYLGEGQETVLARIWPLTGALRPGAGAGSVQVPTGSALSQARTKVSPTVLESLFGASAAAPIVETLGLRVFDLVATAFDGTTFDLDPDPAMSVRYATPSGGRCPQARVVTLVVCGTRRILAARVGSYEVSEQALWDQMVTTLQPGTINFCDRNFFSMDRWRRAAGTGAHLVWRVKNGKKSLPAKVIATLPDGSHRVRLRESDAMRAARRKATGQPNAPRLKDITARLVEFDVIVTDEAGKRRSSHFRVLTTLSDHDAYPATDLAQAYAERWQVELVYKTIKSTLRGPGRRLRGHTPDLADQEVWGCSPSTTPWSIWPWPPQQTGASTPTRSPSPSSCAPPATTSWPQPRQPQAAPPADTWRPPATRIRSPPSPPAAETAPTDTAPAPAPPRNDEPNTPARSHTPSTSPKQIYPN
jgi:hypothetical protein